jgi:O-antigen/teichoic acid export membrane protein
MVNTGSNVLVMLVKLTLTLIMTPFYIKFLGNYDYGLWEMVMSVLGYMGMLNLGINPAISRFAAKHNAETDTESLRRVFSSAFVFLFLVGVIVAFLLSGFGLLFADTMAQEGQQVVVYTLFMLILAGQMLVVFPGHVAESFLEGFQKYHIKNNVTIVNSIVGSIVFYVYATPENALLLLAGVSAVGLTLKYFIYFAMVARPAFGALVFHFQDFSLVKLKELLQFSLKSFVQGIATNVENATDTIVIGSFLGPAAVPFYSIPLSLTRYIRALGWTLSHAFMPFFSDLATRDRKQELRQVYLVASKVVAGLVAAMGVGILGIGTPFLALWIGPEYTKQSDEIILLLVLFTVLPLLNPFSNRYLTAVNKHGILAKLAPISAAANLVLSIILVQYWGIIGVAVGSLIPTLVLVPVVLRVSCRELGLPVRQYLSQSLAPLVFPLAGLGAVLAGIRWYSGVDNYGVLILTVIIGAVVCLSGFWFISLTGSEREFLGSRIRQRLRRN